MSLFFRNTSIFGRFPFVRLLQIRDNPRYLFHILLKNLLYKRIRNNFSSKYEKYHFLSGNDTLNQLILGGKSLARFSDGEFEMLTGGGIYPPDSNWSQRWSKPLEKDLLNVLQSEDEGLLVAVDPPETFLREEQGDYHIPFEPNMWVDMRRMMWRYLVPGRWYGHSHLFLKENCPDFDWAVFNQHVKNKSVIVACGNTQKLIDFKIGRETFFIETGVNNAYEKKEEIKNNVRSLIQNEKLKYEEVVVFASLGPTACIIAAELTSEGICVWDTGHIFEFAAKGFIEAVFNEKL